MLIALCDDETESLTFLQKVISKYFQTRDIPVQIDLFLNGENLLQASAVYDIYFLDIYLPGISGMDTAEALLKKNSRANIIFSTSSSLHAVEAFSLNAAHYLLKPFSSEHVENALDRCMARLKPEDGKYLKIKTRQTVIPIAWKNIIYIEVQNKICTVYTKKGTYQTYATLDSIYENLNDDCFMKPQRSYIVNMNYIDSFYFGRLELRNGKEVILSRSQRTQLKQQYQDFLFSMARKGEL